MRKRLAAVLCTLALTTAFTGMGVTSSLADEGSQAGESEASRSLLEPVVVYGNTVKEEGPRLHITSSGPHALHSDVIVNITEHTRILDASTGFPVPFENIPDNSLTYAYIGPAMTLSLPPIANASLVLCNIPDGMKAPEFLKVSSFTWNDNGAEAYLKATNGKTYTVLADCSIVPYLTRNYVDLNSLEPGRICLLWPDANQKALRIVLFAD